jgi:hypothetical protein
LLLLKSSISKVSRPAISLGITPPKKLLDNTLQVEETNKLKWLYQMF